MSLQVLTPMLVQPTLTKAFAEPSLAFCYALSEAIFADPRSRQFADLAALAFWLRKANIQRLIAPYQQDNLLYKPLGLVFHNTPANVDSLFVYSGILSLLMGNRNIIRLSSRAGGSAMVLVEILTSLADSYPEQVSRLQLVQCEHHAAELSAISAMADARVLWGSDVAIKALRAFDCPAHCRDLVFNHKLSLVVLDASALIAADEQDFVALLDNFCRDNLTFAQQACSSAKVVVWVGNQAQVLRAQQRFWPAFASKALIVREPLTDAEHFDALARAQQLLIQDPSAKSLTICEPMVRVAVEQLTAEQVKLNSGNGLFLELITPELAQLTPMLRHCHQTVSWWGLDPQLVDDWFQGVLIGIDRLVPVGEALMFDHLWDGHDLVLSLSRVTRNKLAKCS
ncbi:hypothetical protein HR45_15515 [Shewanella mangrovi]|uniref:long-chain-fatty-acyl-CoA reductase n=1 Tax=Shewanella mangrovi TaxID=1515746 RepID=A0A094JBB1_9GAMM|nr:acyl-CoA reductase [Shewanella mangrovi]KFZ36542.1 hypothetical protein HR45_15515 [Shewanella mangrovi]